MSKILILDRHIPRTVATLGGGDRYLQQLVSTLHNAGYDVHIGVNIDPTYEMLRDGLRGIGATIHPVIFEEPTPDRMADAYGRLVSQLAPDLIHVHYHGSCMTSAMIRMNVLRDVEFKRTFTMHLPLPSVAHASSRTFTLKAQLPLTWSWRTCQNDRKFLRLFDRVICVSQRHADLLLKLHHLPVGPVRAIPNGVDTLKFCPSTSPRGSSEQVVIGAVGNLCSQKRFDLLIEAIGIIVHDYPVKLMIAGAGPDESDLRKRVEVAGLNKIVTFVGYKSNMVEFLQTLDIFAMTSDEEGSPYAALEAMAVGLPSVVTDVGDLPLLVRHGMEGFVVPKGDTRAIAAKLLELAVQSALRHTMGAHARVRAVSEYSVATAMSRTLEVFQSLAPLPV